jgi:hypothetical protein
MVLKLLSSQNSHSEACISCNLFYQWWCIECIHCLVELEDSNTDDPKTCHWPWSSASFILITCLLGCIPLSSFHLVPGLPKSHFIRDEFSTDASCLMSDIPSMELMEFKLNVLQKSSMSCFLLYMFAVKFNQMWRWRVAFFFFTCIVIQVVLKTTPSISDAFTRVFLKIVVSCEFCKHYWKVLICFSV